MKTPSFVKKKVILITLPVNVRSIMPKSALVPVMTITSNAMPPSGVRITDIIRLLVLCRLLLTNNAQTDSPIINDVKKTDREPAVNKDMSILVLRDAFMQPQTAARGIHLMVNAVPHLPLPDVRLTTALPVPVLPPVPMPADIPVTAVVPIPVLPVLKTIPAPWPDIPNAVHLVTDAKIVLPAALLIPVLTSGLQNAVLVMLVPIPVGQVLNPYPVLRPKTRFGFLLPNAAPVVMNANIIRIVP